MLFTSIVFICFFLPFVLIFNYALGFSRAIQNIFLLIVSLIFYAWGEPVYVFLMLVSIVMNYLFSLMIDYWNERLVLKKVLLIISIVMNLSILFVFKYYGFVASNINSLLKKELLPSLDLALPIGISFFTFQALSYVVDVYRKDAKVEKNPLYLGLYISFFPQLIAGPIVRYNTVAYEIRNRKINLDKLSAGCARFAVGFSKKILLANNFAIIADRVNMNIDIYRATEVSTAWVGAIAYMLQIFFDFSAYSDMAIGLGLMFGFKFDENFNYPYISKSLNEFWRRWHISLTTWFHEYVYFPLGGSRHSNQDLIIRNIFIVWLLTGIWHGAEWTFILWGLWNFVFQFFEKLFDFEKNNKIPSFIKRIYLLWVVLMGWVLFRAGNMQHAIVYIKSMYGLLGNSFYSQEAVMYIREYWIYWIAGIICCTPIAKKLERRIVDMRSKVPAVIATVLYPVGLAIVFLLSFSCLVRGSYNPFIYFNF